MQPSSTFQCSLKYILDQPWVPVHAKLSLQHLTSSALLSHHQEVGEIISLYEEARLARNLAEVYQTISEREVMFSRAQKKEAEVVEFIIQVGRSFSQANSRIAAEDVVADIKQGKSEQREKLKVIIQNSFKFAEEQKIPISGAMFLQLLSKRVQIEDVSVKDL